MTSDSLTSLNNHPEIALLVIIGIVAVLYGPLSWMIGGGKRDSRRYHRKDLIYGSLYSFGSEVNLLQYPLIVIGSYFVSHASKIHWQYLHCGDTATIVIGTLLLTVGGVWLLRIMQLRIAKDPSSLKVDGPTLALLAGILYLTITI